MTQLPAYTYPLWQDVFHLTYTENRGAAFGMLQGGRWFFIVATVVVCGGVIWFLYKDRKRMHLLMKISLALILGGALGNFIDRVWLGYVRDMFSAVIFNFAIFNVADMALSIGCGLLFLDPVSYTHLGGEAALRRPGVFTRHRPLWGPAGRPLAGRHDPGLPAPRHPSGGFPKNPSVRAQPALWGGRAFTGQPGYGLSLIHIYPLPVGW